MFKPFYRHHGNVKFPTTEVEQVIKEMISQKDKLFKIDQAISSFHFSEDIRPDKIWQPRYSAIIDEITKSLSIECTSKYSWEYWSQLYFPNNKHLAHHHWNGTATISFVHFIEPNDENSFRFLDNYGNEFVLPEQSEGDIIFFPSYIWHRVKPLKSGRRIVVAGNIEITSLDNRYINLTL